MQQQQPGIYAFGTIVTSQEVREYPASDKGPAVKRIGQMVACGDKICQYTRSDKGDGKDYAEIPIGTAVCIRVTYARMNGPLIGIDGELVPLETTAKK